MSTHFICLAAHYPRLRFAIINAYNINAAHRVWSVWMVNGNGSKRTTEKMRRKIVYKNRMWEWEQNGGATMSILKLIKFIDPKRRRSLLVSCMALIFLSIVRQTFGDNGVKASCGMQHSTFNCILFSHSFPSPHNLDASNHKKPIAPHLPNMPNKINGEQ